MPMRTWIMVLVLLAGAAGADEGDVQLRDGPGRSVVEAKCSMCHSLDYIQMNSPVLDRKGWEASVTKMIRVMGAPIPAEDVPVIVDYLNKNYGK